MDAGLLEEVPSFALGSSSCDSRLHARIGAPDSMRGLMRDALIRLIFTGSTCSEFHIVADLIGETSISDNVFAVSHLETYMQGNLHQSGQCWNLAVRWSKVPMAAEAI